MSVDHTALAARAEQLTVLARAAGLEIEEGLGHLPEGDDVARIGYLAHQLGLDLGLALDHRIAPAKARR